jgi:alkylhydroperoxidase/carboxymuconolactone decarboxylase family protein YurZ
MGGKNMTSIKMIEVEEATGKVKEIYQEIMESLGIDFVPNMYKTMAHKPDFLETHWHKTQAVMAEGKLDKLTKEIIAVAVSAVSGCDY